MAKKCTICMSPEIKEKLREEIKDPHVLDQLDRVPDCPNGIIVELCISKKRAPSKYQIFVSECMKGKHIKGREEAPQAMKECAIEWRKVKDQS